MEMCSPVRVKPVPYISSEQGDSLITCSSQNLETNMVQKFTFVSVPWDMMGHESVAGKSTVKMVNGDFSGRLPIFPLPQSKQNYFKEAGEMGKAEENRQ